MSFGQSPGPPATASQVQQLQTLLHQAGHTDFRDARGPLGLNQRQAAGKFTRTEAETLIAQLEAELDAELEADQAAGNAATAPPSRPKSSARPAPRPPTDGMQQMLRKVPTTTLAAELQRRGWVVLEP